MNCEVQVDSSRFVLSQNTDSKILQRKRLARLKRRRPGAEARWRPKHKNQKAKLFNVLPPGAYMHNITQHKGLSTSNSALEGLRS